MRTIGRLGLLLSVLLLVASPLLAQEADEDARIDEIIAAMSTEERVGQLFMVPFPGPSTSYNLGTRELIQDYKIGGVLITSHNIDNAADNTPLQAAMLTNDLQRLAYEATRREDPSGEYFIPLFIAVDHEGDGIPRVHFWNGATPIPPAMAIGATWDPGNAEKVGAIVGHELQAVGVNMLLGPVLDVLIEPHPEGAGDISIRVFGGDPEWVGVMGRAYIRGVHQGSDGRVLAIAKHFPGHGASDRHPDWAISTVNKSRDDLMQSDLLPFFAVTSAESEDPDGVADGMMPSHIRYPGLFPEGDSAQMDNPISLDRAGMAAFLDLEPLVEWRSNGGLIVCDALGTGGVKKFYDPLLQTFPHRQVARDALMAGNDVLPTVDYALEYGWSAGMLPNVKDTIIYFRDQYESDPQFRERVDDALRRILRAKLRLYPDLSFESAQVETDGVDKAVGRDQDLETIYQIGLDALTLLYPSPDLLRTRLPSPPRINEDILIMGCFDACLERLPSESVLEHLLNLYGPSGSGQIDPDRVHIVNFTTLRGLLDGRLPSGEAQALRDQIDDADWILLVLLNYRNGPDYPDYRPDTAAGRQFLSDDSFDLEGKKVVALAHHAPYYLDATAIDRLTAYYAVYSKIDPFIQISLQAVFQDVAPRGGAPPVSVDGISYDLQARLQPDIEAVTLTLVPPDATPIAGDQVQVQTSPVRDFNGHLVLDGKQIRFTVSQPETGAGLSLDAVSGTVGGVASAHFTVSQPGQVEIVAHYGERSSKPIVFNVESPTPTPSPTPKTTEPPGPVSTIAPTPTPELTDQGLSGWLPWLLGIAGIGLIGGLAIGAKLIRDKYRTAVSRAPSRRGGGSATPQIRNPGQLELPPQAEAVLSAMFPGYQTVVIKEEFSSLGYSGSWVYRVHLLNFEENAPELPLVVKIGSADLIRQEVQAYRECVHNQWPGVAELHGEPVFLEESEMAGLCYPLMGGGIFQMKSLREYCLEAETGDIRFVLEKRLFRIMEKCMLRPARNVFEFPLRSSYDAILPVNLLIEPGPLPSGQAPILITPDALPTSPLQPGAQVRVEGFVVTELDPRRGTVTLNTPPGKPPHAYRLRLQPVEDLAAYQMGRVMPPVEGVVGETRRSRMEAELAKALGSAFDPAGETVTLPGGPDGHPITLPNPLSAIPAILSDSRHVKVNYIHGDMNLGNVLVDPEVRDVRLIDFAMARRDHVLHDFAHLEMGVVTEIVPVVLAEAGLPPETIYPFYEQLHRATFQSDFEQSAAAQLPHAALEKPFAILSALRKTARGGLYDPGDFSEYYEGLIIYLLGALKFKDLDGIPTAKKIAFWSAATLQALSPTPRPASS